MTELNEDERTALIFALGTMMSNWSEEYYCASWLIGTEDGCPKWCRAYPEHPSARSMNAIANMLGHWVKMNLPHFSGEDVPAYLPYDPKFDVE